MTWRGIESSQRRPTSKRGTATRPNRTNTRSTSPTEPTDLAPLPGSSILLNQAQRELASQNPRRFTVAITGTVPGIDPEAERDLILSSLEQGLLKLQETNGIILIGAGYRSDPVVSTSAPTVTVPVVPATPTPDPDGSGS